MVGDMADMLYKVGMLRGVGSDTAVGNVQGVEQRGDDCRVVVGMVVDEDKQERVPHGKRLHVVLLDSNTREICHISS